MQLCNVDLSFQIIDPQGKLLHRARITKPSLEKYCLAHGIDLNTINWNLTQERIAQMLEFQRVYYLNYTFEYPGKEISHKYFIHHPILQNLKQIVQEIRSKVHQFHNFLIDLDKEKQVGLTVVNKKRIITNYNYKQKLLDLDLQNESIYVNNGSDMVFYCPKCKMKVLSVDTHQLKCPYCSSTYQRIDDFLPSSVKKRLSIAISSKVVKPVCIKYVKAWITTEGIFDPETFEVSWDPKALEKIIRLYNEYYFHSPYSTTKRIIEKVIRPKTNSIFTTLITLRKFRNKLAKRDWLRSIKSLLFKLYDMDDRMFNTFATE